MIELVSPNKIKNKKQQGNDRIIDAILQEWISRCREKMKVLTEENEGADIPAHDKHADR